MLDLKHIDLQFGSRILFEDLNFSLYANQKVGVIGRNGTGKTSLFNLILNKNTPDHGEILFAKNTTIAFAEQEIKDLSLSAIDYVIAGYPEVGEVFLKLRKAESQQNYELAAKFHQRLSELQGYDIEAKASEILHGLGFSDTQLYQPIKGFSGGWRVRLSLARCLLAPADLLLLDEPTNHLDIDAQFWLEEWLKNYAGSILVISHDRDFLDAITTHILLIENMQTKLYQGNYSTYEQQRAQQLALQNAMQQKQQKIREHTMKFVNRFRAKATKAKQVQSRLKLLEKMPEIACAQVDSAYSFEFFSADNCSNPLINFENVEFAYTSSPIFNKINFSINNQDRIGLLGLNGAGKSTLIKLITGALAANAGKITRHKSLRIGYFAQHQLEILHSEESPLWHLEQLAKDKSETELRTYLGRFGFGGDMAKIAIKNFSGGEKARLALALIIWQKPNLLLLDEPTNHLDIEMREALTLALQGYEGALLIIAHDRHLLRSVVDEFWLVDQGSVDKFDGDLLDYHQWLKTRSIKQVTKSKQVKTNQTKSVGSSKRLAQLENKISKVSAEITEIDEQLADQSLYQATEQTKLTQLSEKRALLGNQLAELEAEWLELAE